MDKLLVNQPSGEQSIIEIDSTGSYFDQARVVWDERVDGEMPHVISGKMQRNGKSLITLTDYLPSHQEWLQKQQEIADIQISKADIEINTKFDPDLELLRKMDDEGIDEWFANNIKDLDTAIAHSKKITKILVKGGLI